MLPSGLPEQVADDEDLARFLFQGSQYNSTMVKPAAFLPNPKDRETSVCRHGREPGAELWELGRQAARERTLYGAGILRASAVRMAGLDVTADEPPRQHAVICGWTWLDGDPDLQKARQKEEALHLANAAGAPFLFPGDE